MILLRGYRDHGTLQMAQEQIPSQWEFVGSNDERCDGGGRWTVLCRSLVDDLIPTAAWTKHCDVRRNVFKKFRCLGINVLNSRHKAGAVSLGSVRMWERTYD